MRHFKGRVSRLVAGCIAATSVLGTGVSTAFASAPQKTQETEETFNPIAITYRDDDKYADGQVPDYDPVPVNANTFPDPMFRSAVSSSFDKDGNGILDSDEILKARNIWCNKMGVKSMAGIEYLVELRGIYCMDNQIETMDLSHNKLLTGIWCSGNKFRHIDVSMLPDLEWIYCFDCNLTELDVSHNPKMAYVECNTNPIKELDFTKNPLLEHLTCGTCELTELDLSQNPRLTHLDCFQNKLKTLDLSHNLKMKRLDVWKNPGLRVDISMLKELQTYNCAKLGLTSLDVSHNPELQKLICSYNDLTSLDLSHNPKLAILQCEDNNIKSLDLTNNPQLRLLQAAINDFSTLDIGGNPYLVKAVEEGVFEREAWGSLWLKSWTLDYGGDDSTGGDHIFLVWVNDAVNVVQKAKPKITGGEKYSPLDPGVKYEDLLTREILVETLYNMAGRPDVSGLASRFKDVQPGAWYEPALLWGEANAICVGYPYMSNDYFGIDKWLTRQDVAFMLMRYAEYAGLERAIDFGRSDEYLDYFDIDYDHWEAICWSATWHIIPGKGAEGAPKSEQRIDPYGRVTRKDLMLFINNMLEINKRHDRIDMPTVTPTRVPKPGDPTATPYPDQPGNPGNPGNPGTPGNPTSTPAPTATPAPTKPIVSPKPKGDVADFIRRLYVVALNRQAEQDGLNYWTTEIKNGRKTGGACAHFFLIDSEEFMNRGLNNEDFVETLYKTFFDRASEPKGKAYWVGELKSGRKTREDVINGFIDSTEWCNVCASYGVKSGAPSATSEYASQNAHDFAKRLYTCCLKRKPEDAGLFYWSMALTNLEKTGAQAAQQFFESDEFRNAHTSNTEFVTRLYTTFMGRNPEADGLAYWVGRLESDASRREVLASFAASPEFTDICAKYGIDRGSI